MVLACEELAWRSSGILLVTLIILWAVRWEPNNNEINLEGGLKRGMSLSKGTSTIALRSKGLLPCQTSSMPPWFKLDFVVPACDNCHIELMSAINNALSFGRGPAIASGNDPIYNIVPKALATTSLRLEDAVARLRCEAG